MEKPRVSWDDRVRLKPATYTWKSRLVTCDRWALASADGSHVCEMECNGRGCTVDYLREGLEGHGTILAFSSAPSLDLSFRRIYPSMGHEVMFDVLAWVNDWSAPSGGLDGGIILSLDAWGNEVAV